jgi:hypothetical protein
LNLPATAACRCITMAAISEVVAALGETETQTHAGTAATVILAGELWN